MKLQKLAEPISTGLSQGRFVFQVDLLKASTRYKTILSVGTKILPTYLNFHFQLIATVHLIQVRE
ncbi:hypothetical protein CEN46_01175 [Fischerella thermalis CCMEE 5318]|uniref:Uncharacterized protein n=1 Tax=Fischerella thermalis CCMEE 5318 TaxID=2019666 RepID=A0A2N6LPB4_9CYAN|nr:hypothetical protein CEN46_01175 [Fischerella thermalis CCMEE 5318]